MKSLHEFRRDEDLDKMFRSSLDSHKISPEERVWFGIEESLNQQATGKGFNWTRIGILAAFLIVIGGAVLWGPSLFNSATDNPIAESTTELESTTEVESSTVAQNTSVTNTEEAVIESETDMTSTEKPAELAETTVDNAMAVNQEEITGINSVPPVLPDETATNQNTIPVIEIAGNDQQNFNNELSYMLFKGQFLNMGLFSTIINNDLRDIPDINKEILEKYNADKRFDPLIGLHITPMKTYFAERPSNNAYSIDFTVQNQFKKFIVQSGIAYSKVHENGRYRINYESYDSVGYYNDVVSFEVDPDDPNNIIMNTKAVSVYDSVEHYQLSYTENTYAYLQIPLFVGYRIFEKKDLSVYLKGGIIYSHLIQRNEGSPEFNDAEINILNVERFDPKRVNDSWQLGGSIMANYAIHGNLHLSVEPIFMYYMNKLYQGDYDNKYQHPYSIGLKTGIIFNF